MAKVDFRSVGTGAGHVSRDPDAPLHYGAAPAVQPIQDGEIVRFTADVWAASGFWAAVSSSNVRAFAYESETNTLFAAFRDGSVYSYDGVPWATALDAYNASSPGKFVHQRLSGKFAHRKLI